MNSRARAVRIAFLALLFLVGTVVVWVRSNPAWGGPGLTWDEAFYYPTYKAVAAWTQLLGSDPGLALSSEGIRLGWEQINELPPLTKWLGAAATLLPGEGWGRLAALRVFPAAAFGLGLVLLALLSARLRTGPLPVVLYFLLPVAAGHAQFAATETLFATVTLLVLWTALHDLRRWRWRVALGVALGLAVATKVNGIILLATVGFWLLTRHVIQFRRPAARTLRRAGIALATVLVVAPAVAFALWPWLWDAPAERLAGYYHFIRHHAHQGVWFLGERRNFGGPFAPPWYPLLMILVTVPLLHLALFALAAAAGLGRYLRRGRIPAGHYLVALLVLAPLVASSLPSAPKYDGTRLFFPLFAPACLLTALGLQQVLWIVLRRSRWLPEMPRRDVVRLAVWGAGILLLLGWALAAPRALRERPSIDHYNLMAGLFSKRGAPFPFEQTYWGNALTAEVVADLNKQLPPGARVKTLALQGEVFPILQGWGVLRSDLVFDGEPPYDAHLIQNRRGFWGRAEWAIFSARLPLQGWGSGQGGEPLIFLYDGRPPGSEQAP